MVNTRRGSERCARKEPPLIRRFIASLDGQTYAETEVIHSAVERKFEIIGEAPNQLSKLDPMLAGRIPGIRDIIAFRNVLIQGYAAVEHQRSGGSL